MPYKYYLKSYQTNFNLVSMQEMVKRKRHHKINSYKFLLNSAAAPASMLNTGNTPLENTGYAHQVWKTSYS